MFDAILGPIIGAVRTWMAGKVYDAARDGATLGLQRFAADFGQQFEALPAPAQPVPEALPQAVPMPAAAQITSELTPTELVAKARDLIAGGLPQRQAAQQLGIPESTLRTQLKRES